jgi:hypothetical protein
VREAGLEAPLWPGESRGGAGSWLQRSSLGCPQTHKHTHSGTRFPLVTRLYVLTAIASSRKQLPKSRGQFLSPRPTDSVLLRHPGGSCLGCLVTQLCVGLSL